MEQVKKNIIEGIRKDGFFILDKSFRDSNGILRMLENEISDLHGTESSLLFTSCFVANDSSIRYQHIFHTSSCNINSTRKVDNMIISFSYNRVILKGFFFALFRHIKRGTAVPSLSDNNIGLKILPSSISPYWLEES